MARKTSSPIPSERLSSGGTRCSFCSAQFRGSREGAERAYATPCSPSVPESKVLVAGAALSCSFALWLAVNASARQVGTGA
jgi:hypothetical protein